MSYFKAGLGGRRRVILIAVPYETDSDRNDEYNELNVILLSHLLWHLINAFLTLFLSIFSNHLTFLPDFHGFP